MNPGQIRTRIKLLFCILLMGIVLLPNEASAQSSCQFPPKGAINDNITLVNLGDENSPCGFECVGGFALKYLEIVSSMLAEHALLSRSTIA